MKVLETQTRGALPLSGTAEGSTADAARGPVGSVGATARDGRAREAGWSPALGGAVIAGGLEARAVHVGAPARPDGPSDLLRAQSGQLDAPTRRRGRTSELRVASPEVLRRGLEGEGRAAFRRLALLGPELRAVLEPHGVADE